MWLSLSNMINDLKAKSEWKIQLSMKINFMSSKDTNETSIIYKYSVNIEIVQKLFDSLLQRYQKGLEEKMKGSDFVVVVVVVVVVDSVDLLHYKCHRISLNCGGS